MRDILPIYINLYSLCVFLYLQGVPLPREVPRCLKQEEPAQEDTVDLDFLNEPDENAPSDGPVILYLFVYLQMVGDEGLDISLNVDMIPGTYPFDEEVSTNPFAKGLEDAEREEEEAEKRRLQELQDANSVPAIISDNRDKLQTIWKDNMQRWKASGSRIQEQEDEILEKKNHNEDIRKEIKRLQSKLGSFQEAIEAKGKLSDCIVKYSSNYFMFASFSE